MNKILNSTEAIEKANNLRNQGKRIVLTGGCFDILHIGHLLLLEKAKEVGDILFVLLESDQRIHELKGEHRPIHLQEERAYMLSQLQSVDYVVMLPYIHTNQEYDELITHIHPSIIAVTKGDTAVDNKQRQAKAVGATVAEVINYIPSKSSSAALKTILNER